MECKTPMQTLLSNHRPTHRPLTKWPAVGFIVIRMAKLQGTALDDSLFCGPELRYHLLGGERFSALLIGRLGSGVVEMPHSWATLPAGRMVRCRSCPGNGVQAFPGPLAITVSRRTTCASTEYWHAHSQASPAITPLQNRSKTRRVIYITANRGQIGSAWGQRAQSRAARDFAFEAKLSAHSLICTWLPMLVTGQMVQHDAVFTVSNED